MATDFEQMIKGKEKVKFESKGTKGDVLRKDLKKAIEELNLRESKDRPKTLKRGNKGAPKKLDFDRSEKNLRKEFDLRFDKPKFEDKKPKRVPGKQREMIPLRPKEVTTMAKGGRAGYKAGSKGCKLAMKGKGRAYGKNS
jgi:hypothetical protein